MATPFFDNLKALDTAAYEKYGIESKILMENAAVGVKNLLIQKNLIGKKTIIVVGSGDNGADGYALSRMIPNCYLYEALPPKSPLCKLQHQIAQNLQIPLVDSVEGFEVVIDSIFGSGLNAAIAGELADLIDALNMTSGVKIAVDIPGGVRAKMQKKETAFRADYTVTMGALKTSLLSDYAKDIVGEITVCDLGLSYEKYTDGFDPVGYLLDSDDFCPPIRKSKSSNKGDYGHLAVISGEFSGASVIAANAALRLGAGLVSIVSKERVDGGMCVMNKSTFPKGANAVAVGQGLGDEYEFDEVAAAVSGRGVVLDADLFKKSYIKNLLKLCPKAVLTPHPKEFSSLLSQTLGMDVNVDEIQSDRFGYAALFCKHYPEATLVLKGANTIIGQNEQLFVMGLGSPALAKGGSGDTLTGAIGGYLAQGFSPLDAAKNGTLAVAMSSRKFDGNGYSMTAEDVIKGFSWI